MSFHGAALRVSLSPDYKKLKAFGFEFFRHAAGSHEIWHNPKTGRFTTIPNHPGDMPEGTLRAILKQAGIDPDEFLKK